MGTNEKNARGAVGFYLSGTLATDATKNAISACNQALRHFPWLKRKRLQHGVSQMELWGRHVPDESIYVDKLGNLFLLVGSPMNVISWADALNQLARQGDDAFELPWEGRCILIRVCPDGKDWTIWNDWCGSIPVFHTIVKSVPIVSSLEPPVVVAAGFTPDDFSMRGIVEMLVHGHFLGRDTLFTDMQTLQPDSVSCWRDGTFVGSKVMWSVEPSDSRWDYGWDELADEMHDYTVKAIGEALRSHDKWILPLSGGMDSRLIACVGAEQGTNFQAYTYGPATWNEPIYARQIARVLGIPWQKVDVGANYLADYAQMWLNWFGSSLHAHGMYQVPFLERVRAIDRIIVMGFIGDPLAGLQVASMAKSFADNKNLLSCFTDKLEMWSYDSLRDVLLFDPEPYWHEQVQMLNDQMALLKGSEWQRRWFLFQWNHVFGFSYYQPMMYDYWKGVSTPYMNREYARFCLSLSRLALEERRLQKEMLKRYWPAVAKIAGTYSRFPLIETKQFMARRIAARFFPRKLRIGPLREFNPTPNNMDPDCVLATGENAMYPLPQKVDKMAQTFFKREGILYAIQEAKKGTWHGYEMCQALMPIANRF